MSERTDLLESISNTIHDYRSGDLEQSTPEHVERWVNQFPEDKQLPILKEMDHVLKKTYITFENVTGFLKALIKNEKLAGEDACVFWKSVNFLAIQAGGNSQREMLSLFNEILKEECGFGIDECGEDSNVFIYLDDGLFTGNRIRRDLEGWIQSYAPEEAVIHVINIAQHSGGQHYAKGKIEGVAKANNKVLGISWWRAIELEDRRYFTNTSDVLRPVTIPDKPEVKEYIEELGYQPTLRVPGNVGKKEIFSSEEGRNLLEQEFLIAGVHIRQICPNLGDTQRPLGHMTLHTPGFGSLIVTFRNCPNNAPLALWVDEPWYPLFQRATNSQTAMKRLFSTFMAGTD
ncbi:MAG: hypothetical protein QM504_08260 [Pseudomonadota bacterium]